MAEIVLTQGKVALVDDSDFLWLSQWSWCAHKQRDKWYAKRGTRVGGRTVLFHMAAEILGDRPSPKAKVDHINGDGLDNRRENLRWATNQQNLFNRGRNGNNTSGYKGVYWSNQTNRWFAKACVGGHQKYFGFFDDPAEATAAYNEGIRTVHGNFAYLNGGGG